MKIVPIGENVIVRELDEEERRHGRIVVPETANRDTVLGRVLSVGDGRRLLDGRLVPPQLHEGDRVIYSRWAGYEIEIDGEKFRILKERDILARIE